MLHISGNIQGGVGDQKKGILNKNEHESWLRLCKINVGMVRARSSSLYKQNYMS